ncbi:hypothetical protein ACFSTC_60995 [Nonomuraea ferruginea]
MTINRNWGARLRHGSVGGLRAVTLENELLRVTVLPGKGGDVVEFLHKPTDTDFVWLSPHGLRDPREHLRGAADDVAQFVDHYEGGWQEVFPNGGAPSEYRGARLAQHGEVSGLPWEYEVVADSEREVAIRLSVRTRRLPYRLERTLRLRSGTAALEIGGRAANESGLTLHAMWGAAPGVRDAVPAAGSQDPAARRRAGDSARERHQPGGAQGEGGRAVGLAGRARRRRRRGRPERDPRTGRAQ